MKVDLVSEYSQDIPPKCGLHLGST